jgi:hypothetical protein
MFKIKTLFLIIVAISCLILLPYLSKAENNHYHVLSAFSATPATIDTSLSPWIITVQFKVSNWIGIDYNSSYCSLHSGDTNQQIFGEINHLEGDDYTCELTIPLDSIEQRWYFSLQFSDIFGNSSLYDAEADNNEILTAVPGAIGSIIENLSYVEDKIGPVLTGFNAGPVMIDTSAGAKEITAAFSATDPSGVNFIASICYLKSEATSQMQFGKISEESENNYLCKIELPQGSALGIWNFNLHLFDFPGNVSGYSAGSNGDEIRAAVLGAIGTRIENRIIDNIPPITTTAIAGIKDNKGAYTDSVIITLSAEDNEGGVGVASTLYTLDNGIWQTYSTTSPIVVTTKGEHTIQYRSSDWLGNMEAIKSITFTIISDSLAPTTTPAITGIKGLNGWYVNIVTVALDAKDNDDGVGVEKTLYSLDNGALQSYSTATPLKITTDGIHSLQFYSIDYFGNQEAVHIIQIKIDKTSPEGIIGFNAHTTDLEIQGTDNLSKVKVLQVNDKTYTITDEAGNFTKLNFIKIKEKNRLMQAKLDSILYSNGGLYNLPKTSLTYTWDIFKSYVINQSLEVRSGFFAYANYLKPTNKTEIWASNMAKTLFNGLKIIRLVTDRGQLSYKY